MKLIIIESGDQLGKTTLIEGLCKYFNYDNITIRHFGKPPKDLKGDAAFGFQMTCFQKEAEFAMYVNDFNKDEEMGISDFFCYDYPNIIIWNRSHLGEFIYSQMFRNGNPEFLKRKLIDYEQGWLKDNLNWNDVYLITLTANPDFFLSKEDGNSFSKNLEQKTKELELFKEVHEFSLIKNKMLLRVDNGNGSFRYKADILNEVIVFIENKII